MCTVSWLSLQPVLSKRKHQVAPDDSLSSGIRDAGTGGGAGGAAAPVALYQEGQGGQRCPFNLKDCLGEIANCQKC